MIYTVTIVQLRRSNDNNHKKYCLSTTDTKHFILYYIYYNVIETKHSTKCRLNWVRLEGRKILWREIRNFDLTFEKITKNRQFSSIFSKKDLKKKYCNMRSSTLFGQHLYKMHQINRTTNDFECGCHLEWQKSHLESEIKSIFFVEIN